MQTPVPPEPPASLPLNFDLLPMLTRQEQAIAEALIGYRFNHPEWLTLALTHSSATTANGLNNERIEFLGDSILGLVVAEHLVHTKPDAPEGDLTRFRSMVVNTHTLAKVMRGMVAFVLDSEYQQVFAGGRAEEPELIHEAHGGEDSKILRRVSMRALLRLGRGIPANKELPSRIWANMFEAIVGAIYLDSALPEAREFVMRMLESSITSVTSPGIETNHKSLLQHITQKFLGGSVRYIITGQSGPDHEKVFEIQVKIQDHSFGAARGKSKREAEQAAASLALSDLAADWETYVVNGLPLPEELLLYMPAELTKGTTVAGGEETVDEDGTVQAAGATAMARGSATSEPVRRGPVVRLEPHKSGTAAKIDGHKAEAGKAEPQPKSASSAKTAAAAGAKTAARRKKLRARRKR